MRVVITTLRIEVVDDDPRTDAEISEAVIQLLEAGITLFQASGLGGADVSLTK